MIMLNSKKIKQIPTYKMSSKMSAEEKLDITKQLEEAISLNNIYPQKTEWSSENYKMKYGI